MAINFYFNDVISDKAHCLLLVTLPCVHMSMRNPLFCLKHQVVGFVHNHFIYKLIRLVVYIVQTKAKLLITKNSWFMSA